MRWVPRGIIGRIALVLLGALVLEFAGNAVLFTASERAQISEDQTRHVAEQLGIAEKVLQDVHPKHRTDMMRNLETGQISLNWVSQTVITDAAGTPQLAAMKSGLLAAAPALAGRDLRLNIIPSGGGDDRDLLGALRLADGSFVTFRVRHFLNAPLGFGGTLLLHLLLVTVVVAIALMMMRTLLQPMRNLARAADRAGHGQPVSIAVTGPREVRQVAEAFAAMQARLLRMVNDNTQALIAVSHDLRTPVQRLKLRAELIEDEEIRDAMTSDLDDIEHFTSSVLAYIRGDGEEEARLVDVAAIVLTLVDNTADGGADIAYHGPDTLEGRIPMIAFKRALANLVENAVRYAGHIRVTLASDATTLTVAVEDDGPGIPADQRAEALLPFRRVESSRQQGSGGAGLGLAIVQRSVEMMGGSLSLGDSPLGGLRAAIEIRRAR